MSLSLIQISAWNDSGGGFLHRLFDGHSQLNVWPFELLLGRDAVVPDRFDEGWFKGRFRWPRLGPLESTSAADVFAAVGDNELRAVLAKSPDSKHIGFGLEVDIANWQETFGSAWRATAVHDQASALRLYLHSLFQQLEPPGQAGRPVLGHCPVAILDAPEIWADFADARLIHVVRSPLAGFGDMQRRHPDLPAERYALKWSMVNGFAATLAGKYPDLVRLVAFADLLHDRAGTMRGLSDWLGLAYEPGLQVPTWRGRPIDPANMGPFGGVPVVDAGREASLVAGLQEVDRATLTMGTNGTRALLQWLECAV